MKKTKTGENIDMPDGVIMIYVKGPSVGTEIGGASSTTAIGYIVGSGMQIFHETIPDISDDAKNMYFKITEKMKS